MSDHQFLFLMLLLSDVTISIYEKIRKVKTNFDFIYQKLWKTLWKTPPLTPVILGFKKSQKKFRGCCIFYLILPYFWGRYGVSPLRYLLHIIYGGDIP